MSIIITVDFPFPCNSVVLFVALSCKIVMHKVSQLEIIGCICDLGAI